jgi:hypothetical protein
MLHFITRSVVVCGIGLSGSLAAQTATADTATSAGASDPAASASELFERGLRLVEAGEFAQAIESFEAAYKLRPHPVVLYNIATSYAELNQTEEAIRYYRRYLNEAGAAVEPAERERTWQKVAQLLEKQLATEAESAALDVQCNVPQATLFIDDGKLAESPFPPRLYVQSGERRVRFERLGYASTEQRILLEPSAVRAVRCALSPLNPLPREYAGELRLEGAPAGTRVAVDQQSWDMQRALPIGGHHLRVHKDGFREWRSKVNIVPGSVTTVRAELVPLRSAPAAGELAVARRDALAYAFGGVGLALAGAAVGTYFWNKDRSKDWETEDARLDRLDENELASYAGLKRTAYNNALNDSVTQFQSVWIASGAAALALLGASGTLLLWPREESRDPPAAVSVQAGRVRWLMHF